MLKVAGRPTASRTILANISNVGALWGGTRGIVVWWIKAEVWSVSRSEAFTSESVAADLRCPNRGAKVWTGEVPPGAAFHRVCHLFPTVCSMKSLLPRLSFQVSLTLSPVEPANLTNR